jgi:hypothetical protein
LILKLMIPFDPPLPMHPLAWLAGCRRKLHPVAPVARPGLAALRALPMSQHRLFGRIAGARTRYLGAILLLAALVSCAGPAPEPVVEAAVFEPGMVCRVGRNGGPAVAERGIGGTGAAAKARVAERGIGGTGIVGVVTGFASICVDGLEVRFDRTVPVFIDGTAATPAQLLVGQLVVIKAGQSVSGPGQYAQARTIAVRYEVSGPVETMDDSTGTMTIAGQRVVVLPTTWMAARPGIGNWIAVSGLRQPDGTIVASRLDRGRIGAFAVHGQISRERDTTRVGSLALYDPAAATVKPGTFVSVVGKYRNGLADVTSIDADLLLEDPAAYFGIATDRLVVQAFVRVEGGNVSLNNGPHFKAGPDVHGNAGAYRNAIVWLQRTAAGVFTATELHYTNYRAQPNEAPVRSGGGRGATERVAPPDMSSTPRVEAPQADTETGTIGAAPAPAAGEVPTSKFDTPAEPPAEKAFIAQEPAIASPNVILSVYVGGDK